MPFTDITPEQREAALAKARYVRTERAKIKRDLKNGVLDLPTVLKLDDSENIVSKMKVVKLLEALPGYGKVRSREVMLKIGISEIRRVAGLTPRQRRELENYFVSV